MELLLTLFQNKVFLAVLIAAVIAQVIKIHFLVIKQKQKLHIKDIFLTGGMPSSHSAAVSALAVIIGLTEGMGSLFVLSLVLAVVVIRDAMGVRRTAGEEGKIINRIIKAAKLKIPEKTYALGHTPSEVLVGMMIGISAAVLVYLSQI